MGRSVRRDYGRGCAGWRSHWVHPLGVGRVALMLYEFVLAGYGLGLSIGVVAAIFRRGVK